MVKNLHPATLFVYFFYVIFAAVFTFNPLILIPEFIGALMLLFMLDGLKAAKMITVYIIMIALIAVTNPLFSHNGATVLFFIDDKRITLEALIYGLTASLMIVGMLVWFNCFNKIFDSERLIYLIGSFFPKLALVFSMTFGFIPRLIKEFKSISNAQKSIKQHRVKRYIGAFSAVITRSMEAAIITSDSMNARGYRLKGRTFFHRFAFAPIDAVYMAVFTLLFSLGMIFKCDISYYPYFKINLNSSCFIGAVSFAILALFPFILELKEALKWRLSLSKI